MGFHFHETGFQLFSPSFHTYEYETCHPNFSKIKCNKKVYSQCQNFACHVSMFEPLTEILILWWFCDAKFYQSLDNIWTSETKNRVKKMSKQNDSSSWSSVRPYQCTILRRCVLHSWMISSRSRNSSTVASYNKRRKPQKENIRSRATTTERKENQFEFAH